MQQLVSAIIVPASARALRLPIVTVPVVAPGRRMRWMLLPNMAAGMAT
ncbi:hypothetical protein [Mycolicibacterium sp. HS_4_1]